MVLWGFLEVVVHRLGMFTITSVLIPDIMFSAPYSLRIYDVVADRLSCSVYSTVCCSDNELMTANHNDGIFVTVWYGSNKRQTE